MIFHPTRTVRATPTSVVRENPLRIAAAGFIELPNREIPQAVVMTTVAVAGRKVVDEEFMVQTATTVLLISHH